MTESSDVRPPRWRRLLSSTRERVEVVALSLVLILCGAVAFAVVPAVASDEKLAGEPVPAGDMPAIVATALSCPSLNPPRLAAQLMAASGFSEAGANGNIAGLDSAAWSKWRPSSTARVTDRAAVIAALGHRTCETVGQLRAGGLSDDLWPAAIAAEQAGVDAVLKAKGVPAAQKKHVDTVIAYSRWYADQDEFKVDGEPADVPPAAATPVPAELVAYVKAAGQICPAITPARVAAQLQALSAFDTNLRSADGRVGVAQFTPALWSTYQARTNASMWDPEEAIPALGVAMCKLNAELAGLGGDPYVLALGAYQWGPNVVRQAGGLPRTTVTQLADRVVQNMPEYEKDKRLAVVAPKPAVTTKAPVKPSASASSAAPGKTTPPTTAPVKPTTKPLYESGKEYEFVNVHAGGS
ncbi:MAG: lytic transglycosylase domain-containing protein, partial [Actinoplanes sp.]